MTIVSDFAINCLKNFTVWGGTAGFVSCLVNGKIAAALITAFVFGVLVVGYEFYSRYKFRQ